MYSLCPQVSNQQIGLSCPRRLSRSPTVEGYQVLFSGAVAGDHSFIYRSTRSILPAARYPLWARKETPKFRSYHLVRDEVLPLTLVVHLIHLQLRVSLIHLSYMLLLLSLA